MVNRNSVVEGARMTAAKRSDVMLMAAKVNIDIVEIENLFGVGQKKGRSKTNLFKVLAKCVVVMNDIWPFFFFRSRRRLYQGSDGSQVTLDYATRV